MVSLSGDTMKCCRICKVLVDNLECLWLNYFFCYKRFEEEEEDDEEAREN